MYLQIKGLPRPMWAPEGEGGGSGEGAGSEAEAASGSKDSKAADAASKKGGKETKVNASHDEATEADKGKKKKADVPARPEWAPENFWNKDKGELNVEELAKGFTETKKKLSMRTDDLAKTIREDFDKERLGKRPESADKYELRLPKDVPANAWQWNEKDPLLTFGRQFAFESGMDQDGFDKLVAAYVESEIAKIPDIDAETKRLGEKGKERLERIDNWLEANVSKGAYAAISSVSTKADVIVALEELMQKAGAPAFVIGENLQTGDQDVLSDALLRTWQADERYWNPQKPGHKQWVEKVTAGFKKLYPQTAGGGVRK